MVVIYDDGIADLIIEVKLLAKNTHKYPCLYDVPVRMGYEYCNLQ